MASWKTRVSYYNVFKRDLDVAWFNGKMSRQKLADKLGLHVWDEFSFTYHI